MGVIWMAVGLAGASTALAWSSKACPLFQRVHQIAIEKVLGKQLSAAQLKILQDEQDFVDTRQGVNESNEHSMTGLEKMGQDKVAQKVIYMRRTEAFIRSRFDEAMDARNSGTADSETAGFCNLGQAMHALGDATSPSHEGFQVWGYDESFWAKTMHVAHERVYPEDQYYRERLEGAIRWAYDIYIGKATMPDKFFTADGKLNLPAEYGPGKK